MIETQTEVMEELMQSDHEVDDALDTKCEGCSIREGATSRSELWIGCDGVECSHGVGWWHQRCTTPDVTAMYPLEYRKANQKKQKDHPMNWWCAACIEKEPNQEKRLTQLAQKIKHRP